MLVTIDRNYQFNYVFYGDRRKPVILFLHGFMGCCNNFSLVAGQLPEFCCLMVDLPGHGKTEVAQDANYQMSQVAEALILLLKELGIQQCWLFGYSMGGRLALYMAVHFPQYFLKVILESTSPGLRTQSERDRRIAQDFRLAKELESTDLTQFIRRWYANPLFESFVRHPEYSQAIAQRLSNNPLKLAKSLRLMGLGMQSSLWNSLTNIEIPLVLIVGELDIKFMAINKKIDRLCSVTVLNIAKNCGHNIHFEQPIILVNFIKDSKTKRHKR